MSQASNHLVDETRRMRRILLVGPTGVGKSALINMLINNNVNEDSLARPVEVDDTSQGQTSFLLHIMICQITPTLIL
ncbi:unnamed protein product [Adineta steineri]|uniref:G domain-containing protein n=1 Tax=Adineta steineri TaxID=433720 RepID=A0A820D9W2_9BILA|nr:unnamed protein product [Adineta steineri]